MMRINTKDRIHPHTYILAKNNKHKVEQEHKPKAKMTNLGHLLLPTEHNPRGERTKNFLSSPKSSLPIAKAIVEKLLIG